MQVYIVNAYNIHDFETYKKYPPLVAPLLVKYGAKILAMDMHPKAFEGIAKTMNVIIEFPSEEAVDKFYNDPAYQSIIGLRQRSTSNTTMIMLHSFGKK